jgi:hypothetical protein
VRVQAHPLGDPALVVVAADMDLSQRPVTNSDGLILLPEAERRLLEQSIERFADLLAVARRTSRRIFSAVPEAALRDLNQQDRKWTESVRGFAITGVSRIYVDSSVSLADLPVAALMDRRDGVTLLAEALSSDHETVSSASFAECWSVPLHAGRLDWLIPLRRSSNILPNWIINKTR